MSLLFIFFVLPFLGALVVFYLLGVKFSLLNIAVAAVFAFLFGSHMVVGAFVVLGILYVKEKLTQRFENRK